MANAKSLIKYSERFFAPQTGFLFLGPSANTTQAMIICGLSRALRQQKARPAPLRKRRLCETLSAIANDWL